MPPAVHIGVIPAVRTRWLARNDHNCSITVADFATSHVTTPGSNGAISAGRTSLQCASASETRKSGPASIETLLAMLVISDPETVEWHPCTTTFPGRRSHTQSPAKLTLSRCVACSMLPGRGPLHRDELVGTGYTERVWNQSLGVKTGAFPQAQSFGTGSE